MPDPAPPPAPAALPTPPAPPVTPPAGELDPTQPYMPRLSNPEDDPNHQLAKLLAKRKGKKDGEKEGKAEEQAKTTPELGKTEAKTAKTEEAQKPTDLGGLLSSALKFKPKQAKKPDEAPKTPPETPKVETKEGAEPPKSIVSRKKAAAPAADPVQMAAAAATAAVRAIQTPQSPETAAPRGDSRLDALRDSLADEDRHEYEVAEYLSRTNPKYKDAPKVVLDQIKAAETYSQRWEQQNPGKVFDPKDEDHNEFYDSLEKPWADYEFRAAESEMAYERVAKKEARETQAKINELEQDNARLELSPVIERTVINAADLLAQSVGDGVRDKIVKEGFDKFVESDPITAGVLNATLVPLQPMIDTIVKMDDARGRFPFNEKDQNHQAWLAFVLQKEQEFAGQRDSAGKLFASRHEYKRLSTAERSNRWYLTPDHLLSELVLDAAEVAKERITEEKERQKKIALSLGYIPASASNGSTQAAGAPPSHRPNPPQPTVKPASPSVGGSPKIDNNETAPKIGKAATLAATNSILFPR